MCFPVDYYDGVVRKLFAHKCQLCKTVHKSSESLDSHYALVHHGAKRCHLCAAYL